MDAFPFRNNLTTLNTVKLLLAKLKQSYTYMKTPKECNCPSTISQSVPHQQNMKDQTISHSIQSEIDPTLSNLANK